MQQLAAPVVPRRAVSAIASTERGTGRQQGWAGHPRKLSSPSPSHQPWNSRSQPTPSSAPPPAVAAATINAIWLQPTWLKPDAPPPAILHLYRPLQAC